MRGTIVALAIVLAVPAVAETVSEEVKPRRRPPTMGERIGTVPDALKKVPAEARLSVARSAAEAALAELPGSANNEALWQKARQAIGARLERLRQHGSLVGGRPEHAWFVRCDASTMDAMARRAGRLRCTVGVAPLRAGEFESFQVSRIMRRQ